MNQMAVDPTPPPSTSSKCFPPTPSSVDKRAKILLSEEQLTTLSSKMNRMKHRRNWQIWVEKAEADDSLWWDILSDVLMCLDRELASTNMKDSVFADLTLDDADDILGNFNEDQLEGWKVGVRNGVKKSDWIDLLARRTYISDYQITQPHLFAISAELKTPKKPPMFRPFCPQEKVLLRKIYSLFVTDWAAQPQRSLGNAHTIGQRRKPYGHTSGTTMIPTATRFMCHFILLFNRPAWASQEQLMNLGKNTFPYRFISEMHDLLVFFLLVSSLVCSDQCTTSFQAILLPTTRFEFF